MSTKSKYALVTGGSRGIGKSICIQLAKQGYHILINYTTNEQAALTTKNLVEAEGQLAEVIQFNVANRQETREAIENWYTQNPEKAIFVLIDRSFSLELQVLVKLN